MRTNITIFLEKLQIPFIEINKAILDINIENKSYRLFYPMTSPLQVSLSQSFISDKEPINITIMLKKQKKYIKIAKSEFTISSKYFMEDKIFMEKWIYLKLFIANFEHFSISKEILNPEINNGKIFLMCGLAEQAAEWKQKVENFIKENKEITNNSNNDTIKYSNLYEDGLSEISISLLDDEEKNQIKLSNYTDDDYIEELKALIDNDYKEILPKDPEKLRQLNEILYSKFTSISNDYNEILIDLNKTNENLRNKAKLFYQKYKELKKLVKEGRADLKEKNFHLKREIEANNQENKIISNNIEDFKAEKDIFREKVGIERAGINLENMDLEVLSDIIRKFNNIGIDIFSLGELNEEEKNILTNIIGVNKNIINSTPIKNDSKNIDTNSLEKIDKKEDSPNKIYEADNENYYIENEENLELGNKIVSLIEKDVNDLFSKKKIQQVTIDQNNAVSYIFQSEKNSEEVTLKIVDDVLLCEKEDIPFKNWLLQKFGI